MTLHHTRLVELTEIAQTVTRGRVRVKINGSGGRLSTHHLFQAFVRRMLFQPLGQTKNRRSPFHDAFETHPGSCTCTIMGWAVPVLFRPQPGRLRKTYTRPRWLLFMERHNGSTAQTSNRIGEAKLAHSLDDFSYIFMDCHIWESQISKRNAEVNSHKDHHNPSRLYFFTWRRKSVFSSDFSRTFCSHFSSS